MQMQIAFAIAFAVAFSFDTEFATYSYTSDTSQKHHNVNGYVRIS